MNKIKLNYPADGKNYEVLYWVDHFHGWKFPIYRMEYKGKEVSDLTFERASRKILNIIRESVGQ